MKKVGKGLSLSGGGGAIALTTEEVYKLRLKCPGSRLISSCHFARWSGFLGDQEALKLDCQTSNLCRRFRPGPFRL